MAPIHTVVSLEVGVTLLEGSGLGEDAFCSGCWGRLQSPVVTSLSNAGMAQMQQRGVAHTGNVSITSPIAAASITETLVRFGTPVMTQIRLVLVREPAEEGLFLLIGTADAQSVRYTVGLMAAAHRIVP